MRLCEHDLLATARIQDYKAFDEVIGEWERLGDEDGAANRDQRQHNSRDAKLIQEPDGSWQLTGRWGSPASTWRDPAGHWHTRRPDGTEI